MRHLLTFLLITLVAITAGRQVASELDANYDGSAGSEDIYFDSGSSQPTSEYIDSENNIDGIVDTERNEEEQQNIAAVGETEASCEYSCPRYYRPVCVRRNDQLITYATPCEYYNQLRCANVARREKGATDTPTFQLLYKDACREN